MPASIQIKPAQCGISPLTWMEFTNLFHTRISSQISQLGRAINTPLMSNLVDRLGPYVNKTSPMISVPKD